MEQQAEVFFRQTWSGSWGRPHCYVEADKYKTQYNYKFKLTNTNDLDANDKNTNRNNKKTTLQLVMNGSWGRPRCCEQTNNW